MIAEVEAGNVSAVIVKDMSRFGRDYLKVGFYTEVMFKEKGVRFIAINNGIDSANQQDSDFTPFLNIMNEWYARDASRKIQAVFKSRMQDGKRVSPSVPYGYLRSPEDKQTLIIDEEPAAVVRRIYQMVIEGKGITAIADILTAEKVLIPSAYAKIHCPENDHSKGFTNPYLWSATAVSYILEKQEYMGHLSKRLKTENADLRSLLMRESYRNRLWQAIYLMGSKEGQKELTKYLLNDVTNLAQLPPSALEDLNTAFVKEEAL